MNEMPTLVDTIERLRSGALASRDFTAACLERIGARDGEIGAWAALDVARALALASESDRRLASGVEPGALHGLPIGVKDILDTADLPTECGSPIFAGNRPARDAVVVERLKRAGAFVMGKTVTTEFAFMRPGKTRNPWNPAHTPGGSSSGSAAAVAAGFVPGAIGTQTNGSVIRPAAFCGVVGYKPTLGLIPWTGGLQFSETLDQIGMFARTVADAARLGAPLVEGEALAEEITPRAAPRIGVLAEYPWNRADPEMAAHFAAVMDRLRTRGATIEIISLPDALQTANVAHRTIMLFEAARIIAPLQDRHRASMSRELNEGIDAGRAIPPEDYARALVVRAAAIELATVLAERFDAIASPPAPGAAPARLDVTGDPSFCTLWSLVGFPAVTIPTGLSSSGLPFGLQLATIAGGDTLLLSAASWCEAGVGWSGRVDQGVG